jgi:hypothetical protein
MRTLATLLFSGALALTGSGCGDDAGTDNQPATSAAAAGAAQTPSRTRGGTITIGEETRTFVASIRCSVCPNNQVNCKNTVDVCRDEPNRGSGAEV